MDRAQAQALLEAVAAGSLDPDDALDRLATAPYDELAHSLVDLHRELRTGDPEVVYGAGKTTGQVLDVVEALRAAGDRAVLVTRAAPDTVAALQAAHDDVTTDGATVAVGALPRPSGTVAVLAAGTSDGPVAAEAALTARAFGAAVERVDDVGVAGLHRLMAARPALDRADFRWVTSHNFRKTTATLLDQAGLSARVIADQLGHARPSMTQDVYMGRKLVDGRAVEALEEAFGRAELIGNNEPLEGKDVG